MKKISIIGLLLVLGFGVQAQIRYNSGAAKSKPKSKGFDPQKLVVGGGIGGGLANGIFNASVSPMVGYRITPYFMAGVSLAYSYTSIKDDNYFYNTSTNRNESYPTRYSFYSPGLWARVNFLKTFFIQGQFEYHLSNIRWTEPSTYSGGSGIQKVKVNYSLPTLLVSAGYRVNMGGRAIAYFGLSYDVLQNSTEKIVTANTGNQYMVRSPYYGAFRPIVGFGFGF